MKKIPLFTLLIIVIAAISITMLQLDDLSWQANVKSYSGLIVAGLLLVIKVIFKIK